jgi:hypothetical protein
MATQANVSEDYEIVNCELLEPCLVAELRKTYSERQDDSHDKKYDIQVDAQLMFAHLCINVLGCIGKNKKFQRAIDCRPPYGTTPCDSLENFKLHWPGQWTGIMAFISTMESMGHSFVVKHQIIVDENDLTRYQFVVESTNLGTDN